MKKVSTRFFVLFGCLFVLTVQAIAQQALDPKRIQWFAPLAGNVVKTVVDVNGNVWALSAPNTFQVVGPDGNLRWTKAVSSLTVADFAVAADGQLLLIGLPASGSPIAERYDASQARMWSNRLDSLSSADASQLSIALSGTGSSVAFGLNTQTNQRVGYYFIRADGSLGTFTSVEAAKPGPVRLVRPVVFNAKELIFGVDQPTVPDAIPLYYRLLAESAALSQRPAASFASRYDYVTRAYGPPVAEPVLFRSLPLLTDGRYVMALIQLRYDRVSTAPAGTTTVQGGVAQSIISPTDYDNEPFTANYQYTLFKRGVVSAITASLSQLQADKNRFITAQVATGATPSTAAITINQYQVQPTYNSPGPYLADSLHIGAAYSPQTTNADKPIQQLTVLRRSADGTLLLAGATSGTMVIGNNRFEGTVSTPAHFLALIGPEQAKQQLATEQVPYSTTLPGTTNRVLTNAQRRVWIQLTDSTFRAYDSQGNVLWEKQVGTGKLTSAGVDDLNNLYVADYTSVSLYDSTGAKRWTIHSDISIDGAYRYGGHLLAINPGGGGIWTDSYGANSGALNYYGYRLVINEFTADGRVVNEAKYAGGYPLYSSVGIRQIITRSNGQHAFVLNETFNRTSVSTRSLLVNYLPGQKDVQTFPYLGSYPADVTNTNASSYSFGLSGPLINWAAGDAQKRLYTSVAHVFTYFTDVVNQYAFFTLDSVGNKLSAEVGTPFAYRLATAAARAVTPNGTILTLQPTIRTTSAQLTTLNVVLSEHAPTYALRNTIQLGTLSQPTNQPASAATTFEIVKADADGTILLTGVATGTLTIGTTTITGSRANPVRFLLRVSPYIVVSNVPAAAVCTGTSVSVTARLKGFFDQPATVELAATSTANPQPLLTGRLPVNASTVIDTTLSAISLPIPGTLAAGTYWLRVSSGSIRSAWQRLTVLASPGSPTATQQGDELVASGNGPYQWYNAQNQPITSATEARFRPQTAGSYYVVSRSNGCTSAPSAALVYIITATEPLAQLTIYPNPATDRLLVRWPDAGPNARLRLFDAQGRLVQSVARQGEVSDVPIQHLPGGVFLLHLSAEGQPTQVRKVVVQRP